MCCICLASGAWRQPAGRFLLVRPALPHHAVRRLRARRRPLHAAAALDEAHHLRSFHFLDTTTSVIEAGERGRRRPWLQDAVAHLVGFPPVGEGLPQGHAEAPHVTLTGELVEVDAFRRVPLQRPFTGGASLEDTTRQEATRQLQRSRPQQHVFEGAGPGGEDGRRRPPHWFKGIFLCNY